MGINAEHLLDPFQILEALETFKRECQFFLREEVEYHELMLAVIKVVKSFYNFFRVVEEIADDNDQTAAWDALGDVMEDGADVSIRPGFRGVEFVENAPDLAGPACSPDEAADGLIKSNQSGGVALFDEQVGQRGPEMFGVFEFRNQLPGNLGGVDAGIFHRAGDIDGDGRAEVGFLDVLANDAAVALRHHAPVEILWIISRSVFTMLGKFDRGTLVRGSVTACERADLAPACIPLQAPHDTHGLRWKETHGGRKFQEIGHGKSARESNQRPRSSFGASTLMRRLTTSSLVTPAASALKVVMTRWRKTGIETAATSAVVA